jgi:LacI family transcriptional regulator
MSVTIKDVAQAANVSVATVSRVLTGKDRVSEEKRRAVKLACKKLKYQPDSLAASLRSGSSSTIGMLIPDITNSFFPAVVQAAEQEFAAAGLELVFCDANNEVATEARRLQTLLRRRVDALLVCPVHVHDSVRALRSAASSARLLQLERRALDDIDFLGVDQTSGMHQVVEHLALAGVSSAVFVGANPAMSSIVERVSGFHAACAALGVIARPDVELNFPDVANGRAFGRGLAPGRDLPDAFVCVNDEVALGLIVELKSAGIPCPEHVAITGYDDILAAELFGLTTVAQPLHELGREAARLLKQSSGAPRHVLLKPTLVPRATTGRQPAPEVRAAQGGDR